MWVQVFLRTILDIADIETSNFAAISFRIIPCCLRERIPNTSFSVSLLLGLPVPLEYREAALRVSICRPLVIISAVLSLGVPRNMWLTLQHPGTSQ